MKVLHLTAADHGGAGSAAHRLHLSLRTAGIDSRMCVFDKRTSDPWTTRLRTPDMTFGFRRFFSKAIMKIVTVPDYLFQLQHVSPSISAKDLCNQLMFSPDIIVVHYLSNFLSYHDVLNLQKLTQAPVIWNLLDMGGLTGGCHYAWSCHRFEASCGHCPALRFRSDRDVSARALERKIQVMSAMQLAVVAGSTLLQEQARRSTIFGQSEIRVILIGVDPTTFCQRDRSAAKRLLGLSPNKRTVLFGAQSSKDRRKGYSWLIKSLQRLTEMADFDHEAVQVFSIGKVDHSRKLDMAGYTQKHLGPMTDESRLVLAYQAADVFACPSVQDSGPLMINESLMCGTPVVAFEMGVARDLISSGQTGFVARLEDAEDFAMGLRQVLEVDKSESANMSDRCRSIAIQKCSTDSQAKEYLNLMKKLCDNGVDCSDEPTDKIIRICQ